MPHAHILIWLEIIITTEQTDDVVCAELPDKDKDPELFEIRKAHMVHDLYDAHNPQSLCMKTWFVVKDFQNHSQ